ncbi:MAG: hypothetical protein DMF53_20350 [Acidobacteria bacterium]|nr:MAG: hypothetical protein DMF53_20350 [Acidobacteriota bacterium]
MDVREAFQLDESLLSALRGERLVRIDLDGDGVVVMMKTAPPREPVPALAPPPDLPDGPEGGAPQRALESTRSG